MGSAGRALSNRGAGLARTHRSFHSNGQADREPSPHPSSCSSQLSPKELTPTESGHARAGGWGMDPSSRELTDRQEPLSRRIWTVLSGGGRPDVTREALGTTEITVLGHRPGLSGQFA